MKDIKNENERNEENKMNTNQGQVVGRIQQMTWVLEQTWGVGLDQALVHGPHQRQLWGPLLVEGCGRHCPGYLAGESSDRGHCPQTRNCW